MWYSWRKIILYFNTLILRRLPCNWKEKRILFIHVPKTAGASLRKTLCYACNGHDLDSMFWHVPIKMYATVFDLSLFFKFGFVRHPVSRLYSTYRFVLSRRTTPWLREWIREHYSSFDEFVIEWLTPTRFKYRLGLIELLWPQTWFVTLDGKIAVDFLGRHENINEDYQELRELLKKKRGIELPEELPRVNVTKLKPKKEVKFLPETIERIYQLYEDDFKLLGYEPDKFTV